MEEITSRWENEDNDIIQVAMAIVTHTKNIAEYCKGMGDIEVGSNFSNIFGEVH